MKVKIGTYPKKDKQRKVEIKIDPWDTWSMDHTLSLIIVPMLIQLKETKHGSPHVEDIDVPEELKSTSAPPKKDEWDTDENWHKRWDWVMDEMIWTFKQISCENNEQQFFDYSEVDENVGVLEQSKKIKIDKEGLDLYHKRIDNGLRLFGKYFRGLWD